MFKSHAVQCRVMIDFTCTDYDAKCVIPPIGSDAPAHSVQEFVLGPDNRGAVAPRSRIRRCRGEWYSGVSPSPAVHSDTRTEMEQLRVEGLCLHWVGSGHT